MTRLRSSYSGKSFLLSLALAGAPKGEIARIRSEEEGFRCTGDESGPEGSRLATPTLVMGNHTAATRF